MCHTHMAYQKTHITAFRQALFGNIIPYDKCHSETSAVGVQFKIVRIINYPFVFVSVRFLNAQNNNHSSFYSNKKTAQTRRRIRRLYLTLFFRRKAQSLWNCFYTADVNYYLFLCLNITLSQIHHSFCWFINTMIYIFILSINCAFCNLYFVVLCEN